MAGKFDLPRAKRKLPTYPADHKPFTKVPDGGSSCANCKYGDVAGPSCQSPHYQAFFGRKDLPSSDLSTMCSDWWEPRQ